MIEVSHFGGRGHGPHEGGYDPEIRTWLRCTYRYPPSFIILCLIIQKLSCWQTNKHVHKQRYAAENIYLALLFYASG